MKAAKGEALLTAGAIAKALGAPAQPSGCGSVPRQHPVHRSLQGHLPVRIGVAAADLRDPADVHGVIAVDAQYAGGRRMGQISPSARTSLTNRADRRRTSVVSPVASRK